MKIIFLGTSHGVPSAERYCQSILIETEGGSYLIDAGAPVMDCLLRMSYDLKKIKAVFVTHMHGDHTDGLFGLLGLASWYYKEMDFDVFLPEKEGLDGINAYMSAVLKNCGAYPNDRVRMHLFEDKKVYAENGVEVSAFPTDHIAHIDRPAYGFLVKAEGKQIYISGDLSGKSIDYPEFLNEEPVDLFVVECAHFSAEGLMKRLECCKAKRVMIVHVYPLDKYSMLRSLGTELPFALEYPKDGDSFEI